MLNAIEWAELSVFQNHFNNLKAIYSRHDTLYNDEQIILSYFDSYIQMLQKKQQS